MNSLQSTPPCLNCIHVKNRLDQNSLYGMGVSIPKNTIIKSLSLSIFKRHSIKFACCNVVHVT